MKTRSAARAAGRPHRPGRPRRVGRPQPAPPERARADEPRAPALPVLLVEDDADAREAMTALLSGAGLRVIASDEGQKALELAGATHPALVVLDLSMRGMSGWEFLERRVDEPALAGIPVLVVTGSRDVPPEAATAVLQKPVDPERLLAMIRGLLRRATERRPME